MAEALAEAEKAFFLGEVPIGAVVVVDGKIIARSHNLKETDKDATAHAEILAIREASKVLDGWRLNKATLYVTLEPCPMCAGAIVQARLGQLVYGAPDPKGGAVHSLLNLLTDNRFNHQVDVLAGIMEEPCEEILKRFFKRLRK